MIRTANFKKESNMPGKKEVTVDPDDISKRIFTVALKSAIESMDGSVWKLSKELGVGSNIYAWLNGHMPPYKRMQDMYPTLIKIAGGLKNGK